MKKNFVGTVKGVKMAQTAVVEVASARAHPLYHKIIRRTKKYHVHDPFGVHLGDRVSFVGTRPLSRTKRWIISRVLTSVQAQATLPTVSSVSLPEPGLPSKSQTKRPSLSRTKANPQPKESKHRK